MQAILDVGPVLQGAQAHGIEHAIVAFIYPHENAAAAEVRQSEYVLGELRSFRSHFLEVELVGLSEVVPQQITKSFPAGVLEEACKRLSEPFTTPRYSH